MESGTGSNNSKKQANWIGRDVVAPTNVLHLATECGNKGHSAAFSEHYRSGLLNYSPSRVIWFLDPFVGSGTTVVVANL